MSFNGLGVGVAHGVEFESSQGESPLGFFFNYFYFYFLKKGFLILKIDKIIYSIKQNLTCLSENPKIGKSILPCMADHPYGNSPN
jgi:hypothetical protein